MKKSLFTFVVLVFMLGWTGNTVYSEHYEGKFELNMPAENEPFSTFIISKERDSPADRITEDQIHVFDSSVVIEIKNAEWSTFTDTNSMDPVIDQGANAIHMIPSDEDEIQVGDIVAYDSKYSDSTIIHRVIEIGHDEDGKYFIMKGDNNPSADPGKVRFDQIKRVLVAIIY